MHELNVTDCLLLETLNPGLDPRFMRYVSEQYTSPVADLNATIGSF